MTKWKQCCICLDERFEDDLRMHKSCGACLCETCFSSLKENQMQSPEQTVAAAALATLGHGGGDDFDIMGALAMEQINSLEAAANNQPSSSSQEQEKDKKVLVKCPMCNVMEDEDLEFPFLGEKSIFN